GLLVGSFLNVVIYRLPVMMERGWRRDSREFLELPAETETPFNLATPPSRCNHCNAVIRPWQNIPVLSFVVQRGRCAACGTALSWQYPAVELLTAVLSAAVVWQLGDTALGFAALPFTWMLVAMAVIDLKTTYLPDVLTLPFLWLGMLAAAVGITVSPTDAIWGAVAGYGALWLVFQAFKLATGKEGMGYGDFKLLAGLGAWLSWTQLPIVILLSSVSGAVVGSLWLMLSQRGRETQIPFGPWLAMAGWLTLMWGEDVSRMLFGQF
ncbi:MAG: A24 family peptidase, partial [Pseudomonadota bacterium]